MRILFVHNYYQQAGGEDQVFLAEQDLMRKFGHDVHEYTVRNDTIQSCQSKIKIAISLKYSNDSKKTFADILLKTIPDIVHCHNFFPLLTPSIFDACKEINIPTVLTLHNYRIICPSAILMRKNKPWEVSINYSPYFTIPFRVYKNSIWGTASLARMITYHKKNKTWSKKIDRLITLTNFSKNKFLEAGFSPNNIVVKPNFIHDPDMGKSKRKPYALFIGRLSKEKGINFLLDSWKRIDFPLKMLGDGPEKSNISSDMKNIEYLGTQPNKTVIQLLKEAQFLVLPSQCYEGFPVVLVESLACGTPALVTNIGSMAEIIDHEENGLHFALGDVDDFVNSVNRLSSQHELCNILGENGRKKYLSLYTPENNYQQLHQIYLDAIQSSKNIGQ